MLDHLARPHEIERVICEGERPVKRNELEVEPRMPRPRPGERRLSNLGPHRTSPRLGQHGGEIAGACPKVKRPVTGTHRAEQEATAQIPVRNVQLGWQPLPELLVVLAHRRDRIVPRMTATSPLALILPRQPGLAAPTVEALEGQSRPPEQILMLRSLAELSSALNTAADCRTAWVWLLDAGVSPEPDALEAMLDVAAVTLPTPALLAGRLLTPMGGDDPDSRAVAEVHDGEKVLAALERGTVPLRVARRGSLLVRGGIAARLDAHEVLEQDVLWTARLLARELGVLVPSSVAVRHTTGSARPVALGTALRVLRELPPRERLWFAAHFAEETAALPRAWQRLTSGQRRG
jgi:hypothetical protein